MLQLFARALLVMIPQTENNIHQAAHLVPGVTSPHNPAIAKVLPQQFRVFGWQVLSNFCGCKAGTNATVQRANEKSCDGPPMRNVKGPKLTNISSDKTLILNVRRVNLIKHFFLNKH